MAEIPAPVPQPQPATLDQLLDGLRRTMKVADDPNALPGDRQEARTVASRLAALIDRAQQKQGDANRYHGTFWGQVGSGAAEGAVADTAGMPADIVDKPSAPFQLSHAIQEATPSWLAPYTNPLVAGMTMPFQQIEAVRQAVRPYLPDKLPFTSDWFKQKSQDYGITQPPDPDYATARNIAELGGNALGSEFMMPSGAGNVITRVARQPGVLPKVLEAGKELTGAALTGVGAHYGGQLGDVFGFDPNDPGGRLLNALGQTGGGMAPGMAAKTATVATRGILGDQSSGARFRASDATGVPASPSTVGNKAAGVIESGFGAVPFVGGWIGNKQNRQNTILGEYYQRELGQRTGAQPQMDPVETAANVQQGARQALPRIRLANQQEWNGFTQRVGARTGVDVRNTIRTIRGQMPGTSEQYRQGLQGVINDLNTERVNNGVPIDAQLDQTLRTTRQQFEQLQGAANLSAQRARAAGNHALAATEEARVQRLQTSIDRVNSDIFDNTGIPFEVMQTIYGTIGQRTSQGMGKIPSLETRHPDVIYGALRDDTARALDRRWQEDVAANPALQGQTSYADQWRDMSERYASQQGTGLDNASHWEGGDVPQLTRIAKSTTEGPTLAMLKRTTKGGAGDLRILRDHLTPEQWNHTRSDMLFQLGRPLDSEMSLYPNGFSGPRFATLWNGASEDFKILVTEDRPGLRQMIDDNVAALSNALKNRTKAANPSGTAPVGIAGATILGLAGAATHGTQGLLTILSSLAGAGVGMAGYASRPMAQIIANQTPTFANRAVQGTVRELGRQTAFPSIMYGDQEDQQPGITIQDEQGRTGQAPAR